MIKLNIGCNDVIFPGWINYDLYQHEGAIVHDARQPFPHADNTVDFIFSEHFIEHLNDSEGLNFFKEAFRILKPGGVIRTATFSIDDIMRACISDEGWKRYDNEMFQGRFQHLTRTQFFNFAVYEGTAHKYMWNNEELIRVLKEVGFSSFNEPKFKESVYPELKNLEYRQNTTCIVEGIK